MKYFPDNTKVTLDDLESKGIYSEELIENLKFGKLDKLMELDEDKRENRDYMEPILYAVLEKFSTYEVYEYFGDKLKYELSTNVEIL